MEAGSRTGRIIGVVIVIQMLCGVVVNFVLEAPLFGKPGFLVNAAHYPRQMGFAALLGPPVPHGRAVRLLASDRPTPCAQKLDPKGLDELALK